MVGLVPTHSGLRNVVYRRNRAIRRTPYQCLVYGVFFGVLADGTATWHRDHRPACMGIPAHPVGTESSLGRNLSAAQTLIATASTRSSFLASRHPSSSSLGALGLKSVNSCVSVRARSSPWAILSCSCSKRSSAEDTRSRRGTSHPTSGLWETAPCSPVTVMRHWLMLAQVSFVAS